jgi:hypothetical protein
MHFATPKTLINLTTLITPSTLVTLITPSNNKRGLELASAKITSLVVNSVIKSNLDC